MAFTQSDLEAISSGMDTRRSRWKGRGNIQEQLAKGRPLIVALKPSAGAPLHYVVVAGLIRENKLVLLNDPAERKLLKQELRASKSNGKAQAIGRCWQCLKTQAHPPRARTPATVVISGLTRFSSSMVRYPDPSFLPRRVALPRLKAFLAHRIRQLRAAERSAGPKSFANWRV